MKNKILPRLHLVMSLQDDIYEAAFIADRWPSVLDSLALIAGAVGGVAFSSSGGASAWTSSPSLEPAMGRFVSDGWIARNTRLINGVSRNLTGAFLTEFDLLDPGAWDQDPLYTEFFRPNGLGWSAGSVFQTFDGGLAVVSVERAFDQGPVPTASLDALNRIHADVGRAVAVAGRLAFARLQSAVSTLEALGWPAAAVSRNRRLIVENETWRAEATSFRIGARDVLQARDSRLDAGLAKAVGEVATGAGSRLVPFRQEETGAVDALHVLPVRGLANDVFSPAAAILVLARRRSAAPSGAAMGRALFDLTPAEAEIFAGVAGGETLRAIAARTNRSLLTVQNILKAVFVKTGCRRQVDLVRLVRDLAL